MGDMAQDRHLASPLGKVLFVVTGFGKFRGVTDNPSSHLVRWLSEQYAYKASQAGASKLPYTVDSCTVLTVAVQDVDAWLEEKLQHLDRLPSNGPITVLLHFGVHGGATTMRLETQAANEMSFGGPDERSEYHWQDPVDDTLPICATLHTDVNVTALLQRLQSCPVGPLPAAEASTDAGRFLCNYLLWRSLQASKAQSGRRFALFVHVPPFEVIAEELQRRFCLALLSELATLLSQEVPSAPPQMLTPGLAQAIPPKPLVVAGLISPATQNQYPTLAAAALVRAPECTAAAGYSSRNWVQPVQGLLQMSDGG